VEAESEERKRARVDKEMREKKLEERQKWRRAENKVSQKEMRGSTELGE